MTLATHALIGASVASLMPQHPVIGFCAAFASHFVADAIPHYDYPLRSDSINPQIAAPIRLNTKVLRDLFWIGLDMCAGLGLSFVFFAQPPHQSLPIMLGAIGGILPDPVQFIYKHIPALPLKGLQRFHIEIMHSKYHLRAHGKLLLGVTSQVALALAVVTATLYLRQFLGIT